MYIPQVRSFGHYTATRFSLHSAVEHCQRKDVHLHLVLVLHISYHVNLSDVLPSADYFRPDDSTETAAPVDENVAHRDLQ